MSEAVLYASETRLLLEKYLDSYSNLLYLKADRVYGLYHNAACNSKRAQHDLGCG